MLSWSDRDRPSSVRNPHDAVTAYTTRLGDKAKPLVVGSPAALLSSRHIAAKGSAKIFCGYPAKFGVLQLVNFWALTPINRLEWDGSIRSLELADNARGGAMIVVMWRSSRDSVQTETTAAADPLPQLEPYEGTYNSTSFS